MSRVAAIDRFINVVFYKGEEKVYGIYTPKGGMKPDIAVSVNQLPGQQIYQCELRVRNLNVGVAELRTWTSMQITMGYYTTMNLDTNETSSNQLTMTCPLFASYVESPNPDGITVFSALAVGSIKGFLENEIIDIHVYGKVKVKELVAAVLKTAKVRNIAQVLQQVEDCGISELEIENNQLQNAYADSGYALINWLSRELSALGAGLEPPKDLRMTVFNGDAQLWDATDPSVKLIDAVHDLLYITKAYYTGTVLNVTGPWIPDILPGSLFRMPNRYYSAPELYNEINASTFTGKGDIYRIITSSISFSTTEDNQMTLLALPVQYAMSSFVTKAHADSTVKPYDDVITEAKTKAEQNALRTHFVQLEIGTKPTVQIEKDSIWNINWDFGTATRVTAKNYAQHMSSLIWNQVAIKHYKEHELTVDEAEKTTQALKQAGYDITVPEGTTIPPESLYPIVLYATYKSVGKEKADKLFDYQHPGALNQYLPRESIYYPELTNLKGAKEIFVRLYTYFKEKELIDHPDMLITGFALGVIDDY